nr:hypothetical protein [uncultured Lacibacter sp.]
MPIDDLYKKFKEPTPDSLPRFEEESWKKMEQLLDKHLPEKGGRAWPYFTLLGCFSLIFLTTFLPAKQQQQLSNAVIANNSAILTTAPETQQSETVVTAAPNTTKHIITSNDQILIDKDEIAEEKRLPSINLRSVTTAQNDVTVVQNNQTVITQVPAQAMNETELSYTDRSSFSIKTQNPFRIGKPMFSSVVTNKSTETIPVVKPTKNSLSLTVTTGLEAPGFDFSRWGKFTPSIGVGLQYSFRNKIIISTGIAQSTKIYTAQDKDYHAAGYWYNYTTFKKIDADCKIIEIPLSVAYRVVNGKRTNMFISAGSSSYIMRRETYAYDYKNQYGNDTVVTRTYRTNGSHLFSSINLSVIAERKLTNRFSIMAEPIVKIPTAGIGFGKVRLYNVGINVTAKFKLR